MAALIFK